MGLRRRLARWAVRRLIRPGLAPRVALARRRRRCERVAALLPLPPALRILPAGDENPGGEWLLPPGTGPASARGTVLYVHGGGFLLGSPASHRPAAGHLARAAGLAVLTVHYRLAPEHPFPAGLEDLQAAWRHVTQDGAYPVALAGDSAGGWLALALALRLAAAGRPRPMGMALFSPLVDLAAAEAAGEATADLLLPPGFVAEGVRAWRGLLPPDDPRLDLLAGPLGDLPPVFLSFDRGEALAADARRLLAALQAAGVQVRVEEATGLWHAWPLLAGLLPDADLTLRNAAPMLVAAPGSSR